jgi:hypoxanthine phosphoribosyltransferase/SAM-dependent methyltransferase
VGIRDELRRKIEERKRQMRDKLKEGKDRLKQEYEQRVYQPPTPPIREDIPEDVRTPSGLNVTFVPGDKIQFRAGDGSGMSDAVVERRHKEVEPGTYTVPDGTEQTVAAVGTHSVGGQTVRTVMVYFGDETVYNRRGEPRQEPIVWGFRDTDLINLTDPNQRSPWPGRGERVSSVLITAAHLEESDAEHTSPTQRRFLVRDSADARQLRAHARSVARRAGADPDISSPWFNLREVYKQLALLEEHLVNEEKRCDDCILKHFLLAEGLLEEAMGLDETGDHVEGIAELLAVLKLIQKEPDPHAAAQAARSMRKHLTPIVRKTAEEFTDLNQVVTQLEEVQDAAQDLQNTERAQPTETRPSPQVQASASWPKLVKSITGGKKLRDAIYLHRDALRELPQPVLSKVVNGTAEADIHWNIIKLNRTEPKASLLSYPHFDDDPYPALADSTTVDLSTGKLGSTRSYGNSDNPPILHRKEMFLASDDPRREEWAKIATEAEEHGLYANPSKIGFKRQWEELIESKGLQLAPDGHLKAAFVDEEIAVANATCRDSGCVGGDPLVYRWFRENIAPKEAGSVLDFGAGKRAKHTEELRKKGYSVAAWEFGDNFDPEVHDEDALSHQYDFVLAANVLNVQSSKAALKETLEEIAGALKKGGSLIANLPSEPRKHDMNAESVEAALEKSGFSVERVEGSPSAPIWRVTKGGRTGALVITAREVKQAEDDPVKALIDWQGLQLAVEFFAGELRGADWDYPTPVPYDYGYFLDTEAEDGDSVDFLMGPNPEEETVYVATQQDIDTGEFSQFKVLIGFESEAQAEGAFKLMWPPEMFAGVVELPAADFAAFTLPKMDVGGDEGVPPPGGEGHMEEHPELVEQKEGSILVTAIDLPRWIAPGTPIPEKYLPGSPKRDPEIAAEMAGNAIIEERWADVPPEMLAEYQDYQWGASFWQWLTKTPAGERWINSPAGGDFFEKLFPAWEMEEKRPVPRSHDPHRKRPKKKKTRPEEEETMEPPTPIGNWTTCKSCEAGGKLTQTLADEPCWRCGVAEPDEPVGGTRMGSLLITAEDLESGLPAPAPEIPMPGASEAPAAAPITAPTKERVMSSSRNLKQMRKEKDELQVGGWEPQAVEAFVDRYYKGGKKYQNLAAHGQDNVFLVMPSTSGENVIPRALAERLAAQYGGQVVEGFATPTHGTEAKCRSGFVTRMQSPSSYSIAEIGKLEAQGKNVVLVDDVFNTGESMSALTRELGRQGIEVDQTAVLGASDRRITNDRDISRLSNRIIAKLGYPREQVQPYVRAAFEGTSKQWLNYADRAAQSSATSARRVYEYARRIGRESVEKKTASIIITASDVEKEAAFATIDTYEMSGPSRRKKKKRFMGETYFIRPDEWMAHSTMAAINNADDAEEIQLRPEAMVFREGEVEYNELRAEKGRDPTVEEVVQKAMASGFDAVRVGDRLALLNDGAITHRRRVKRPGWAGAGR